MLHWISSLSLVSGLLPVVLDAFGVVGAVWLVLRRERRHLTRTLPLLVLAAAALTGVLAFVVERVWRPFPDQLPITVYLWTGVGLLALLLAGPRVRHTRWVGRAATVVAVVAVLLAASSQVNLFFRAYPTVAAALGSAPSDEVPYSSVRGPDATVVTGTPLDSVWTAPAGMPRGGVITQVDIPGTTSGFQARPAQLYLPPAYLASPRAQLPVLVLLAGQPGTPEDWVTSGGLASIMDAFAAAHDGLAPVVVVADDTGSQLANPMCLDSALGNVDTYLSVDVPTWVRAHLQVEHDASGWAVGGLSYGGTCALQMAVNHPAVYPTFLDMSGQVEPTLGDRAASVMAAFGGDEARYTAVNPLDVMKRTSFPQVAGTIVVGAEDSHFRPQAQQVYAATMAAGMTMRYQELPGGHSWQVWQPGLANNLGWLATRWGLVG